MWVWGKTVIASQERRRIGKEREKEGGLVGGSGTAKARKMLSRWRFGSSLKLVKKIKLVYVTHGKHVE